MKTETVNGLVVRVDAERHKVFVRTEKDKKPRDFRYRPENFKVTLKGKEVDPTVIEKGQRARVKFITAKSSKHNTEVDVARSIQLIELQSTGGESTTG